MSRAQSLMTSKWCRSETACALVALPAHCASVLHARHRHIVCVPRSVRLTDQVDRHPHLDHRPLPRAALTFVASGRGLENVSVLGVASTPTLSPATNAANKLHDIVLIDTTTDCGPGCSRVDTPAACTLFGMVNVSSISALAIGERVGKAGPDLHRSPMKRCSHARLPRCEDHGARFARCLEKPSLRIHAQRMSGTGREDVRL